MNLPIFPRTAKAGARQPVATRSYTLIEILITAGLAAGSIIAAIIFATIDLQPYEREGALYRIQVATALGPNADWRTVDVIKGSSNAMSWIDPDPIKGAKFYRVIEPQPEIFSIEPARFAFGGAVELHVIGQCFRTNTELRLGQQTLSNFTVLHPSLMRGNFTPPSPGVYVFDLAQGGTAVSSFQIECFDPVAPPPSVLQGPPEEPWASPMFKEAGPFEEGVQLCALSPYMGKASSPRVTPGADVELRDQDFGIPCSGVGPDFIWGRIYRSRSGTNTAQGNRWDFSYNVSATQVAGGIQVRDGMGRADVFAQAADGTFTRDEHFSVGTLTGTVFRLTFADTGFWDFLPFDGSATAGKLARIVDRNTNTMRLEYDGAGRLARVVDALDRTNQISYANGKIVSVTDFTGRSVTYAYYGASETNGSDGDLKSVTSPVVTGTPNGNDFPSGKLTTYTYSTGFADPRENSLLLSVTDPEGQTAHRFVFQHNQADLQFLRCIARQAGNTNDLVTYNHLAQTPSPSNQFAAMKIIVNDRVGNVSELSYDARQRLLLLRELTGRAVAGLHVSETTNRPVNKLRAGDPDFFETRFEWNNDSLCTRVVHPRGNETHCLYEREFDPAAAARKKGDLRLLRQTTCCPLADVDRDGLPDLASRVWQFEYDQRFGSPVRASSQVRDGVTLCDIVVGHSFEPVGGDGNGSITQVEMMFSADTRGNNGNWLFGDGAIRPVRSTDPNGNVSTAELDIRGNLIRQSDPFIVGNDPAVVDFAYNSFGQLTGVTNAPDGQGRRRVDTFTYHASGPQAGYLASARRDDGGLYLLTSYEYDARGNITRRIDPRGKDELFTYNALDQLMRAESRPHVPATNLRVATDYFYDANDNVVRVNHENRDEAGTLNQSNPHWTSLYEYDVLDRRTLVADELTANSSRTNRFHYDPNGNLSRVELPEAVSGADSNNVVTHTYDERNLPFESVAAPGTGLGATNRFDYDANGYPARTTETGGQITRETLYAYDGLDRLARTTDAMGNEELFTRDANNNLVHHRLLGELTDVPGSAGNRRLTETRLEFDALDRLTRVRGSFFNSQTGQPIGDGEATTTFILAPNGQTIVVSDDSDRDRRYAYDTANRLIAVTDPGSNVVSFTYDANGNVLTRTQTDRSDLGGPAQVFTATFTYDDWDRRITASDNTGNNQNWGFDSRDNIVRSADPRTNETVRVYDGLSRVTDETHFAGPAAGGIVINASHVVYQNDRLVSSTDGNSNATLHAYDSLDRRTQIEGPDGNIVTFLWDTSDDLVGGHDANGTVISNSFDLLGRCVRKDITPAQGVAATTTFEEFSYDGVFRPVRAANDGHVHTFTWDSRSNVRQQSQTAGGVTLVSTATFDGVGNRLSLTHPSGRIVSSTFDVLDRPATVSLALGGPATQLAVFAYDGPDRLAQITRANGVNTRVHWNGSPNPPNAPGDFGWQQVARVNHQVSGGGAFIDSRVLAYDRAQNKTLRAQTVPFTVAGLLSSNVWSHDALNRLNSSDFFVGNNPPSTRDYQLDPNGNRQAVIDNGQSRPYQMSNMLPEPGDFQMNQYTVSPFGTHQYDRNGNLVATIAGNRRTLYQYDYADRLVSAQDSDGQTITPVADYSYDALGRRVTKTVPLPSPMAPLTTRYFYDVDDGVIEERVSGVLTRSYVMPEVSDEVLVAVTGAGQAQYYHCDDLGNVLALTDAAGNVLERYDYDDYGMPQFLDANGVPLLVPPGVPATESPAGNPFLFRGMFWDTETAFYDAQLDPATGRYISPRDTVWKVDKFGNRSFAGDNPWSSNQAEVEFLVRFGLISGEHGGSVNGFVRLNTAKAQAGTGPVKNGFIRISTQRIAGPGGGGGDGGTYQVSAYWTSQTSRDSGVSGDYQVFARWVSSNNRASGGGIDYNSSRSNKSNGITAPGGGGGGGESHGGIIPILSTIAIPAFTKNTRSSGGGNGIDYNSSRSNKSNGIAAPGGGGGGKRAPGIGYGSSRLKKSGINGPITNGILRMQTKK